MTLGPGAAVDPRCLSFYDGVAETSGLKWRQAKHICQKGADPAGAGEGLQEAQWWLQQEVAQEGVSRPRAPPPGSW